MLDFDEIRTGVCQNEIPIFKLFGDNQTSYASPSLHNVIKENTIMECKSLVLGSTSRYVRIWPTLNGTKLGVFKMLDKPQYTKTNLVYTVYV